MARFRRMQVLSMVEQQGLVPVFFNPDPEISLKVMMACHKGGARCLEMTNRGDGAVEVFRHLQRSSAEECPDLALGVGSIVDAPTAALYIAEGADFVVGPCLDRETAVLCNRRKIPYMPGCATATEIQEAHSLGVEICKIFPGAEVGGPSFVKAMKGPCPWVSIMPTGGVEPTRESLMAWFGAGITAAGIGSNLITREILKKGDWDALSRKVSETLALIREARGGSR